jgi:hypothetical protein
MENSKNVFDLLIAIIPSVIIGFVSVISIIYSNKNQRNSHLVEMRTNKLEKLYEKLCNVNGAIIEEKKKYEYDIGYYTSTGKMGSILKEIESLRVEAKLYFSLNYLEGFRSYAEMMLFQMLHNGDNMIIKNNLADGEYEESDGDRITIVPSTFDQRYDQYEDAFHAFEDQIIRITQKILGYVVKPKKVTQNRRLRLPWLRRPLDKQKSTSA